MPGHISKTITECFHCGENCGSKPIHTIGKSFCCQGCKMVYEILNKSGLCDYYNISENPGAPQKIKIRENKFAFLDDAKVQQALISFSNSSQTHLTFYLPQIHCSSCLWLLENLHKLNKHINSCKVNFERKEATIVFNQNNISLRQIAELLASIGYEPYISLHNLSDVKPVADRSKIYKLGVAGFCFSNIMVLSFPEYFGIGIGEQQLVSVFRFLNLAISLPVFFYSASEFYISAWKNWKHKFINIDTPIVLAICVTFARSVYEVISGTGGGYFDSMSGIVFFMLAGRLIQDKTWRQLSFERDYTSYFPMAVTRIKNHLNETITLPDIQLNDTLLIHHEELIPADGILMRGHAFIDYSFVTGESHPVKKEMGEIVYAGGKQVSGSIEILVIKEVAQSYLTSLWNRGELKQNKTYENKSFVHILSRYFTWVVLAIAVSAGIYWYFTNISLMWNALTAVLIVACPCALLLSNSFTNGNVLRILSRNKLYLRNAQTIEEIASINHIVFDKTGTLTTGLAQDMEYEGTFLSTELKSKIAAIAAQSAHPLSKAVASWCQNNQRKTVLAFKETAGKGVEGIVEGDLIALGSARFIKGSIAAVSTSTSVYVSVEGKVKGKFIFHNRYRTNIFSLVKKLKARYSLSVLSGDNEGEQQYLEKIMGAGVQLHFNQKPIEKLAAIKLLQQQGKKVMMIGDGLNDAGALKQADAGIAVLENSNHFTPASDGILEADQLQHLQQMMILCRANKKIVTTAFVISILYNIIGVYFAASGRLSPMIAAILMPCSSISILLTTFGFSNLAAKQLGLK